MKRAAPYSIGVSEIRAFVQQLNDVRVESPISPESLVQTLEALTKPELVLIHKDICDIFSTKFGKTSQLQQSSPVRNTATFFTYPKTYIAYYKDNNNEEQERNVYSLYVALVQYFVYYKRNDRIFALEPTRQGKEIASPLQVHAGAEVFDRLGTKTLAQSIVLLIEVLLNAEKCEAVRVERLYDIVFSKNKKPVAPATAITTNSSADGLASADLSTMKPKVLTQPEESHVTQVGPSIGNDVHPILQKLRVGKFEDLEISEPLKVNLKALTKPELVQFHKAVCDAFHTLFGRAPQNNELWPPGMYKEVGIDFRRVVIACQKLGLQSDEFEDERKSVFALFIATVQYQVNYKLNARYFSLVPLLSGKSGMVS
jgi:hypothetical protein